MSEQQLNAEQKAKLDSMTSLLDGTLDDIEDLPVSFNFRLELIK